MPFSIGKIILAILNLEGHVKICSIGVWIVLFIFVRANNYKRTFSINDYDMKKMLFKKFSSRAKQFNVIAWWIIIITAIPLFSYSQLPTKVVDFSSPNEGC